ncbi:MAG: cap protein [Patescibacteria group bacterium]|nr:cap protein [Patescibacteria group bacterium]
MNWRLKSKIKFLFFLFTPIVFGIFLTSLVFGNNDFKKVPQADNIQNILIENTEPTIKEPEKPKYYYFRKDKDQKIKISAEAYVVGDLSTGEIILAKNQDTHFPIASVSKLMTALVADKNRVDEDIAKVSRTALNTYGENGGFYLGEKIKVTDLFYPLLMESSNDAAEVIAEFFGRENFLQKMNRQAVELKMTETSFKDPSGLSENNLSTAADLFKFAGYLNQKEENLLKITTNKSYSNKKHVWFSNNQFLHKKEYIGGKSGYIDESKQTVISIFSLPLGEKTSRPIGITLLRSTDRARDVENILSYLKKNIYYGGSGDANADWIKEKLDIPDVNDNYVRLIFGGDIMLDRGVKNSTMKNFGGDYSLLFKNLEIFKEADIVFANLEGPASDLGEDLGSLYSFRMDQSVVPALKGAGISILSVANNHVGDWGREAYEDTLDILKENEIYYTGGGKTSIEAEQPTIIEKNGIKVGYLGFSDVGPNWMAASETIPGLLLANNPRFAEIIKNASQQVDHLIVSFHWGDEYQDIHNARQELLAHKAIDNGAKIVVGHHPHVAQDIEVYKNGYIIYSLGNLIFDQAFSEKVMQGLLIEIELSKDGYMTAKKNIVKSNRLFQPDKVILGKEEIVKFKPVQ